MKYFYIDFRDWVCVLFSKYQGDEINGDGKRYRATGWPDLPQDKVH
jgi:hypothetical protein